MNIFKIAFFCLLLTSASVFSQSNDYYNNRYGRDNNRDLGQNHSTPTKPSSEEIEKAKAKQVDKIIANLKVELTLDELQAIAIKNEIASSIKNIDIVIKKEITDEEKSKEIKALTDRTEITINSFLNAAQKEKYKALIAENNSGKKDKKNKKTRSKTEQSEAKDKTVDE